MLNIIHQGNTNQNHSEISLHTCQNGKKLTTQETTDVGKDTEEGGHSYTVGGNANWYSHSGKQLKIELPYDPAISLLGIYPKSTGMLF